MPFPFLIAVGIGAFQIALWVLSASPELVGACRLGAHWVLWEEVHTCEPLLPAQRGPRSLLSWGGTWHPTSACGPHYPGLPTSATTAHSGPAPAWAATHPLLLALYNYFSSFYLGKRRFVSPLLDEFDDGAEMLQCLRESGWGRGGHEPGVHTNPLVVFPPDFYLQTKFVI